MDGGDSLVASSSKRRDDDGRLSEILQWLQVREEIILREREKERDNTVHFNSTEFN